MKISVVTPAFNASSTIMSSIQSVLDQSHDDWEHLIVDDGSMDDTALLVSSIKDVRVRLFREAHSGVCAARNRGVAEANGEVVTFLDADDVADRDWLATFACAFDRRPDLGLACCGARVVTDGVPNGEVLPSNGGGLLRDHRCLFLAGTYALRRSLLPRVGLFDEHLRFGENTDLGFRVVAALTTSGMTSDCLDRPLITWRHDVRRTDRRDKDRLESAEHTLAKYASELKAMPAAAAALERIAAVNASTARLRAASARGTQHELCVCGRARRQAGPRRWAASCPGSTGVGAGPRLSPLLDQLVQQRSASPHPRVSVLMPVFNGGERIGRAVDSILTQTFTDFELVVVDDGSSDHTAAELSARAVDARLRVIRHEENVGLVASLNHGLALCRGELIARLDADDWALPSRLARQVAEFDARPELVLCASPYDACRSARATHSSRRPAALTCVVGDGDARRQPGASLHDDVPARCGDRRRRLRPAVVYHRGLRPLASTAVRSASTAHWTPQRSHTR